MKSKAIGSRLGVAVASLMLGLMLTSCGTPTPTVNWDSRVGHYTLTQAQTDLGTPTESKPLPNGGTSAEWLTRMGTAPPSYVGMETGIRAGGVEEPGGLGMSNTSRSEYLQLTFDSSGTLVRWDRVYR